MLIDKLLRFALYLDKNDAYVHAKHKIRDVLYKKNYRPKMIFDFAIITLIFLSVIAIIYETKHIVPHYWHPIEGVITFVFVIEYLSRLWVFSDSRKIIIEYIDLSHFRNKEPKLGMLLRKIIANKLEYVFSFFAIIDLLAIMPDFRAMGFLRVFRLFKILRYIYSINEFVRILISRKFELYTLAGLLGFVVFISSTLFYILEAHANKNIHTFFDAVYWSFVSIATVGYGDISPVTSEGRLVAIAVILIGLMVIAFSTSIVVSAFTEKIDEMKEAKTLTKTNTFKEYTIICGYNDTAHHIAKEFAKTNQNYLLIEPDSTKAHQAKSHSIMTLNADPKLSKTFIELNIHKNLSLVILSYPDDIDNLLIALNLKSQNPSVRIIALLHNEATREKFIKIGVNELYNPDKLIGNFASSYINQPFVFETFEQFLSSSHQIRLHHLQTSVVKLLIGKSIAQVYFSDYGLKLLGIISSHHVSSHNLYPFMGRDFLFNPPLSYTIQAEDELLIVGHELTYNDFLKELK